ncbi:AAA domain-containing protein [Streptomyces sp. NPDC058405]|uniref:AAA domain-containing protein n=1 Tax=Streptomyces sp. NPDC058405 TaxID=3346482 RepID=UPI00365F1EB0
MNLSRGDRVLQKRYELIERAFRDRESEDREQSEDSELGGAQTWLALGEYQQEYLLKVWPHSKDDPDASDMNRALWDAELRTLYRACSSPGAERSLMVLREAGVDKEAGLLVMALEAPGYSCLAVELAERRSSYHWLTNENAESRRTLWNGLKGLADGLHLLHEQQVLHTGVAAESVFLDPSQGAESLRLGGFEWSMRVGSGSVRPISAHWGTPPETTGGPHQVFGPDGDWFGFGILAARCLLPIEHLGNNSPTPQARYRQVLNKIEKSKNLLTDIEREFLLRLVAESPLERMTRHEDIAAGIEDIVSRLSRSSVPSEWDDRYVLMIDPKNTQVVEAAMAAGLRKTLELGPTTMFNPRDNRHVAALTGFVQQDLNSQGARLYPVRNQQFLLLLGDQLQLRIGQYRDRGAGETEPTWRHAKVMGTGELRGASDDAITTFPTGSITVLNILQNLRRTEPTLLQNASSWERRLPRVDKAAEQRAELEKFCAFVRVTNQIELLFRDAELFAYRVVERTGTDGGKEEITIEELEREREVLGFLRVDGGLVEFLQRERENSLKTDAGLVVLTGLGQESLSSPPEELASTWSVTQVDVARRQARLTRTDVAARVTTAPDHGILRSHGMDGQIKLIRRRKEAIDRLRSHTYLLRSLANPGEVYMDTGKVDLPVHLDPKKVDGSKRAVIQDVLRVRPIYALQGPPGTGKTTMVAWLLRQILAEDPVAQILITAQAHGAVDVLWSKVKEEAFNGVPEDRRPLAVRLGRRSAEGNAHQEGSVDEVVAQILGSAMGRLESQPARSDLQDAWLDACRVMNAERTSLDQGALLPDFRQLVKRGANLTFCTTSAGELEGLSSELSFDWSIVEESGKVHGFDLALPLQAGHRWLLIGDQKQLPPYRDKDYLDAVNSLDQVVEALDSLPDGAARLLDRDFIRMWRDWDESERKEFIDYSKHWLKVFERIFENCGYALGGRSENELVLTGMSQQDPEGVADRSEQGSMAGMLAVQHRMHPDIGTLISDAYYGGNLTNSTRTESPLAEIPARLTHPFVSPEDIRGKAIVWIDTPWSTAGEKAGEWGAPTSGKQVPRYINPAEAHALFRFVEQLRIDPAAGHGDLKLTVLSPYSQQVGYLERNLSTCRLPTGIRFAERARQRADQRPRSGAFTVDSFQGDQSDIIAVSLVRNNQAPGHLRGQGMGFLQDAPRLNVLLSRAERLLVLVGSWDFFQHHTELVDLERPEKELWHWKKVLTMLDAWEKAGRILRLPADLTTYREPTVREVLGSRRHGGAR